MKRVAAVLLALALAGASLANAQEKMGFFGSPSFVAQPGLIKSFSPGDGFDFNSRWVTVLPTSIPRTVIVGIVQWTPFADENDDGAKENNVAFVYGPVVNIIGTPQIGLDFDALFAYGPTGSVPPRSAYTHKFLVEADFFLKLGGMMNMTGQGRNLSLYGMLAYVLTGLDDGVGSGALGAVQTKDRLVLLTGLSLPLAPWKL